MSTSAISREIALPVALGMTLVAGLAGLPTTRFGFPSVGASVASVAWKVATAVVLIGGAWWFRGRRPDAVDLGLTPVMPRPVARRTLTAIPVVVALTLIAMFWTQIPVLMNFSAAGSGSSYDAGTLSGSVLALELLVRYPITVVVEEAFFRGFLQPRLAFAAPVVTGVLFALYHLQQFETIPSLIPFGIALGVLRWWLGSIWPGAIFHYVGNALFILSLR